MRGFRPAARGFPAAVAVLTAAALLCGCKRQNQIGAITEFQQGGGSGGGGGGGTSSPPPTGVVELKALFSGAQIGQGPPEVSTFVPADGDAQVLPTTPVVVIFSESVDPDSVGSGAIQLRVDSGDPFEPPVPGALVLDPETQMRMALFTPTTPLDFAQAYVVDVGPGVVDLEGNAVTGGGGGPFGVPVGGPSSRFTTFVPGGFGQAPSFGVVALYPPPDDDTAPADTAITLVFNAPVDEATLTNAVFVEASGAPVPGDLDLLVDPRILRFRPAHDLPDGAEVTVRVLDSVRSVSLPTLGPLTMAGEFQETFRVNAVPTPKSLQLVGNAPLNVAGIPFDGRLTLENLHAFGVDVSVPSGKPNAEKTTLLLFQPKGQGNAAARAFQKTKGVGKVSFSVDLSKGNDASAFVDSDETTPPSAMFVGAFASRGSRRSPVGPVQLAHVFVKVSKPDVALGPPFDPAAPYSFRTTLASPAITGRATEPLGQFRAVVSAVTDPTTFDGLPLQGPGVETAADLAFVTAPAEAALPGGGPGEGPKFLPLDFDEIVATDLLGNRNRIRKQAGLLHFEGSVGGALEADAAEDLRVRVVRASNLSPLSGASVRVEPYPFDPANAALVAIATTDGAGEVSFPSLAALGPRILITAWKDGFDLVTLAGIGNPAFSPAGFGVSLLLRASGAQGTAVGLTTSGDLGAIGSNAFRAAAAGLAEPTAPGTLYPDAVFSVSPLVGVLGKASFDARPNAALFAAVVEHDGAGGYLLGQSPLLFSDVDADVSLDLSTAAPADGFATVDFSPAQVSAAGIGEDPMSVTRGRLVARLPGLAGVTPLSLSAEPLQADDGVAARLTVPFPPTLLRDEPPGQDPAYEVLLQPSGASPGLPPNEAALEAGVLLEVEAAETGSTRWIRHRLALDFSLPAPGGATPAEPLDLPPVPLIQKTPGSAHPPSIDIDAAAGPSGFLPADTLLRLDLVPSSGGRTWTVLLGGAVAGAFPVTLALPDVGVAPFDAPGAFEAVLWAYEFPAGSFDFDRFTFSDVERGHRRAARSATLSFQTTAP